MTPGYGTTSRSPSAERLYPANGFSGHGFQHGYAVGRYIAELIVSETSFLDLSRFGPERVIRGEPYPEQVGRII